MHRLFTLLVVVGLLAAFGCSGPQPMPEGSDGPDNPKASECLQVRAFVACQTQSDGAFATQPCKDGLGAGDRFKIAFEVQQTTSLYVLVESRGPAGETLGAVLVHPGAGAAEVAPEQLLTLPNKDWIELDASDSAAEAIHVVASATPIEALEAIRNQALDAPAAAALLQSLNDAGYGEQLCEQASQRASLEPMIIRSDSDEVPLEEADDDDRTSSGIGLTIDRRTDGE